MDDILVALVIIVCMVLLLTGIDGEVKAILALAAGWIFRRGYTTIKHKGGRHGKPTHKRG